MTDEKAITCATCRHSAQAAASGPDIGEFSGLVCWLRTPLPVDLKKMVLVRPDNHCAEHESQDG